MEQLTDEEVKSKYEDVCGELNLDEEAKDSAWKAYQEINNDYVLEVMSRCVMIYILLISLYCYYSMIGSSNRMASMLFVCSLSYLFNSNCRRR